MIPTLLESFWSQQGAHKIYIVQLFYNKEELAFISDGNFPLKVPFIAPIICPLNTSMLQLLNPTRKTCL